MRYPGGYRVGTYGIALLLPLRLAIGPLTPAWAQGSPAVARVCQDAGTDAEREHRLPSGLLLAIGLVESGRIDPQTGRAAAWPWTINAAGTGRMFNTAEEARGATRALLAQGVTSIDVGCFQINLMHHPRAFTSLEEAFNPPANAGYAARFLTELRSTTGSWEAAIAAYHSADAERGGQYRDRVLARWYPNTRVPPIATSVATPVDRILAWLPAQAGRSMQILTPSNRGMAPTTIRILPISSNPSAPGQTQAALPAIIRLPRPD